MQNFAFWTIRYLGKRKGWHVGCPEGIRFGWRDGWYDGRLDGALDGAHVGILEGCLEGFLEGFEPNKIWPKSTEFGQKWHNSKKW